MFRTSAGRLYPVWAFVFSLVFSFTAFFVAAAVAAAVAGRHSLVLEVIFRSLLALLLVGVYVWLLTVVDNVYDHRIAAMGLPLKDGWRGQFLTGCVVGFALTGLAILPIAIWGHTSFTVRLGFRWLPRDGAVLIVLLVGALAEELMFRGYPFQHLEAGIGAAGAIAVFSVLFGTVHLANPSSSLWGLINTVLIGILLSIAYLRTRALWLSWGIHFGWNATLGFLCGLPVSGLRIFNVVVRTSVSGPKWLTGGDYGIEASATGTVAVLIGLMIVWKLTVTKSSCQGSVASSELDVAGNKWDGDGSASQRAKH
jgi:membrane protease YdiL (CAAX protease family)